jgi:hypothetical protein
MLRRRLQQDGDVRKLLQNLPPRGAMMSLRAGDYRLAANSTSTVMKRIVVLLLFLLAGVAMAQPMPREPAPGASSGGLWQRLTPEQRALLWRSLTPEQKADLWRNLAPDDRRGMRERLAPGEPQANGRPAMPHRGFEPGDGPPRMMMSPEDRQRMREQIREAYRLRRERLEAERARRRDRP